MACSTPVNFFFFFCFLVYLNFCKRYHGLLDSNFSPSRSKIAEVNMACSAMRIGCRFYFVPFFLLAPLITCIYQESSGGGSLSGMCGNFYLPTFANCQVVYSNFMMSVYHLQQLFLNT